MRVPGRAAHHLAGRHHPEDRNRRGNADAPPAFRREAAGQRRAKLAGLFVRDDGRNQASRIPAGFRIGLGPRLGARSRSLEVKTTNLRAGISEEERRPLQRKDDGDGVLRAVPGAQRRRPSHGHDDRDRPRIPGGSVRDDDGFQEGSQTDRNGIRRPARRDRTHLLSGAHAERLSVQPARILWLVRVTAQALRGRRRPSHQRARRSPR